LVSANMRLQHLPVCLLVLVLLLVRVLWQPDATPKERRGAFVIVALASPLIFFAPLRNLMRFGNPVYPVKISILGHALPGIEDRYAFAPTWLAKAPQPLRFFASILEIGLPPLFPPAGEGQLQRYSVDQWMPSDHPGSRLGGTLGIGMIALSLLFLYGLRHTKERIRIGLCMLALTALTSMLPQSHELRYTLYWPLSLAGLALALAYPHLPRVTAALSVLLPLVVVMSTRATWIYPNGSTFSELLANKVHHARIEETVDGGTVCLAEPPRIFLYAAKFHGRRYAVHEADEDGVCRTPPTW
jgi:hypothetical protein